MGAVSIGIDIGQKVDPTAIAVIEPEWRTVDNQRVDYYIARRLERLPLGTSYPDVAERLADIVAAVTQRQRGVVPKVFADATGVGLPVVDVLRAQRIRVTPVYFTHGDRRVVQQDGSISLGKAWLVSRLQALLQTQRILLPETTEARVLARELQDYEIRVSEQANDTYGAFKVGTHDDLVTALGLAVQEVARVVSLYGAVGPNTGIRMPRRQGAPAVDGYIKPYRDAGPMTQRRMLETFRTEGRRGPRS